MNNIDKFKKLIDEHEIVSFDIFDTLLLRPYVKPTDLFLHIQNHYKIDDFCTKRIMAETNARTCLTNNIQEVTIDEIYKQLPEEFQKFKEIEIQWESQVLLQNPEMAAIYGYAVEQCKKIILISDMYLPLNTIQYILSKNGFNAYQKIYLSSDYKKNKYTGDLYDVVVKDLDVTPDKILHIGDNEYSDCLKACSKGIKGVLYNKVIDRLFKEDNRLEKLYNSTSENEIKIDISILTMLSAIYDLSNKNLIEGIGYKYAGSMVYSFAKWIEQNAIKSNISNIGLIARDGYFLKKVLEIINPSINAQYIYASRKIIDSLNKNPELIPLYKTQLTDMGLSQDKNTAFVDVRTNSFTSQKFLSEIYPESLWFYWIIGTDRTMSNYKTFYDYDFEDDIDFIISEAIELFMSAPTPPYANIIENNGKLTPIEMESPHKEELYRIEIIKIFEKEILNFAEDMQKIFGEIPLFQNPHSIILWNNLWIKNPTSEETAEFSKIYHATDQSHQRYIPILELKNSNNMYAKALEHFKKQVQR